uniref:Uncharacterized protein n=1 Tax=Candidatus Kentrum eta TaxID=2126337 RepID=A0A450V3T6_9GAMM|nr:MAG: hypothetical protein BECKH772A_GA0070896_101633 [Candidatus Kentron sp. H]VFJ99536.1 MAG: hypothetical protein BECKH772B_GA0070898_101614 [Candidatus Kentron sp. H]VFK04422.1 MAG: hypothetical protein BECKH772C_GA0070978_101803 [Candidatus Kentron sp. H]
MMWMRFADSGYAFDFFIRHALSWYRIDCYQPEFRVNTHPAVRNTGSINA